MLKSRRALLIINPISGTRSKKGLGAYVSNKLREKGIEVKVMETGGAGDAMRFAKEAVEEGFDMVITAGGDGTVNEAANGLSHTQVPLGILPYGSGNGLARALGIPMGLDKALKVIEEGHVFTSDRGLTNGRPFYCTLGMGFDAEVSDIFAKSGKRGKSTYVKTALHEFRSYKPQDYVITVDGKKYNEKAFLIAVCNANQYGNNAYIAPRALLADGLLDVTVVHDASVIAKVVMGTNLLSGRLDKNRHVSNYKGKTLTIEREKEGAAHLDGEPGTLEAKMQVECDPLALKVFTPEKDHPFRSLITPAKAMCDDLWFSIINRLHQKKIRKSRGENEKD